MLSVIAVGDPPGTIPEQPAGQDWLDPNYTVHALPVAYECLLQFCIREMRATWTNNTFHETVVSTWTNQSQKCPDPNCTAPYVYTPFVYMSSKTGTTIYIHSTAVEKTKLWLAVDLDGNVTGYDPELGDGEYSSDFSGAIWRAMNSSATSFADLMDNLANRLSLSLREIPYQPVAVGQSSAASYIACVRWWWLALPVFELVASLFFLLVIMVETKRRRMAPWRNDVLATFFYGFDHRPLVRAKSHGLEEESRQLLAEFRQMKRSTSSCRVGRAK